MCQNALSCQLRPIGSLQHMITIWMTNIYHELTTRSTWKLPLTCKLSWQPHIKKVQNKARKTLGLIKRTLHAAPPQVRKTPYEVLVRPTLEYATCAWSSHTKTDIQKVEQVQHSTARFVTGDYRRTSSVTAMCTNLMWDTLHTRRCIRDATLFYKIHSPWTSSHQFAYHHCHSRSSH